MAAPLAPKRTEMATWLRFARAKRRAQRGVVAAYVHELSQRHKTEAGARS